MHREAGQPLLPFDKALVRHPRIKAQPVVVKHNEQRHGFGKLHQLAEGVDVRGLGWRQEGFTTRTPQRAGVIEMQGQRGHLARGRIARCLGFAVFWHTDGGIATSSQIVGIILRNESLLISAVQRHTRPQHQRDLLARLMVLDAQGAGQGQRFRCEVD